jgi:hypothetical protein
MTDSDFTEEQIRRMLQGLPPEKRHEQESPAHKMIAIYEANLMAKHLLLDPKKHKDYEQLLKDFRVENGLQKISGFTEERVEEDVEAAYFRLITYLANFWKPVIFP